jgi:catechol 2,3-dioxygenase-like lactoylglutathione lyase family enzyme
LAAEFPGSSELTQLLVVSDVSRAISFYRDVVGADLVREYGGTSAVFRLAGVWLLLVTPGGPTADKPTITFAPPDDPNRVSAEMTFRVKNCRGSLVMLVDGDHPRLRSRESAPIKSRRESRRSAGGGPSAATLSEGGFQACRKHPFKRMKSSVVNTCRPSR